MSYEEALAAFRRGDDAEAAVIAHTDLGEAVTNGDATSQVDALCMLARVALRGHRVEEVETRAEQAEQIARTGDRHLQRMPVHLRAVAARMAGRPDEARELYQLSIELNDELGETVMAAVEHRNLAYVEISVGDVERGRRLFAESRRRLEGVETPALTPYLMFDEATVAALDGDHSTAAQKLADAERSFRDSGVLPDPDDEREIAELRRLLGSTGR